jgi:hypothetical protein
MRNDNEQNESDVSAEPLASWPSLIGGVLILLGTGLSMVLQGGLADMAMGAGLLGLVLVLARRKRTDK